ncbi:MAG TPA: BON domain-containing protein [Chitinispirillaceae bacterium]|nr:BON domain-containing protein [Chitinispirillaceae bacterium]
MRTGEQIRNDIIKQLEWDSRVNCTSISVEVKEHTVILTGNVSSYMQKAAAYTDALSVNGVAEVHNHLKIIPDKTDQDYNDEQILWNIQSVITLNPAININTVKITVNKGIVYLGGAVDEFWKKMQTEEIVFDVPGVRDVVSTLSVVPTNSPYDQAISADILSAIQRISNIDIQKISVTVDGGRVTIQGRVPDWHAYTSAHNAAKYTRGVTDLTNKLIIG